MKYKTINSEKEDNKKALNNKSKAWITGGADVYFLFYFESMFTKKMLFDTIFWHSLLMFIFNYLIRT